MERAHNALDFLNSQLARRAFLLGDRMTLADISLAAYTALAGDGGIDLANWAGLADWVQRVRSAGGVFG